LLFSTPALTVGHRSSISRMCSGAIATHSCFRFRPEPFSGSFYLSFCLSVASWVSTADRAGPVRPSRAPVRRLWTLTLRAALLVTALLFTKSHFEWVADIASEWSANKKLRIDNFKIHRNRLCCRRPASSENELHRAAAGWLKEAAQQILKKRVSR